MSDAKKLAATFTFSLEKNRALVDSVVEVLVEGASKTDKKFSWGGRVQISWCCLLTARSVRAIWST